MKQSIKLAPDFAGGTGLEQVYINAADFVISNKEAVAQAKNPPAQGLRLDVSFQREVWNDSLLNFSIPGMRASFGIVRMPLVRITKRARANDPGHFQLTAMRSQSS